MRPKGAVVKVHVRLLLIDAELGWLLKYRHYTNNRVVSVNVWVLKKSIFLKTTKIWGIENV